MNRTWHGQSPVNRLTPLRFVHAEPATAPHRTSGVDRAPLVGGRAVPVPCRACLALRCSLAPGPLRGIQLIDGCLPPTGLTMEHDTIRAPQKLRRHPLTVRQA